MAQVKVSAAPESALKIESTGIEPIPPFARTQTSAIDNFTFWASCNCVIPAFSLGTLAIDVFYMGFWDAFATVLFFNLMSSLLVALFASMGPKTGLRQMVLTRYSFGFYGAMLVTAVNIVIAVGWSAVNVVVGGQSLNAVNSNLPVYGGVIIICILTTVLALFGYHYIHKFDRFAFVPVALSFLILFGATVSQWDTSAAALTTPVASILSFGGAIFGFGAGWTMMAADYTVFQPQESSVAKVFALTFSGNFFTLFIVETIGVGVASAVHNQPQWGAANAAALMANVLFEKVGRGFGSFLLVLMALSIVAGNIPNDYSRGLSMMLLGRQLAKVHRAVWTLIGAVIYLILAILSIDRFNTVLENFLLVIGYFLAPYCAVLVVEHLVFRRGDYSTYNQDIWESPKELPLGAAATFALALGLVGAVLGMAEVFYTGVVALAIAKPFGGDVGFEMAFGFAMIVYLVLRPIEKKQTGR
ncbi:permease for cytosine/purines, uracil, thiamine, allantoin-domain-containing protein [Chytriomyces sp. MP71]|nr:permease for cytosine/purines, uracil, thiamine, allantoin-domain-containing protein [Chytriomyces sp. MP71]